MFYCVMFKHLIVGLDAWRARSGEGSVRVSVSADPANRYTVYVYSRFFCVDSARQSLRILDLVAKQMYISP